MVDRARRRREEEEDEEDEEEEQQQQQQDERKTMHASLHLIGLIIGRELELSANVVAAMQTEELFDSL